jgi:hypothetical protein
MVDVNVIETDSLVAHACLGGRRLGDLNILPGHDFGPTDTMYTNGKWHSDLLCWCGLIV